MTQLRTGAVAGLLMFYMTLAIWSCTGVPDGWRPEPMPESVSGQLTAAAASDAGPFAYVEVDNIAELRTRPGGEVPVIFVQAAVGSSSNEHANYGGGMFRWDSASAAQDDGATVVCPTSAEACPTTGRWKRYFDSRFDVRWFGAVCDGTTFDDAAFRAALRAANAQGGTLLVPSGATCRLQNTLNLANVDGTGKYASGITIRGAAMMSHLSGQNISTPSTDPSTLLFDGSPTPGNCNVTYPSGAFFVTGGANYITLEDLTIKAGSQWNACLINAQSIGTGGDPNHLTLRRVRLQGNGTTEGGLFLLNASYTVVDSSLFQGFTNAIYTAPVAGNYVVNLVITNSIFYSQSAASGDGGFSYDPNPTIYLKSYASENGSGILRTLGLHMTGNAFEVGPNAILIEGAMEGGDITGNWFQGELDHNWTQGTWLTISSGQGCSVTGNWFSLGYGAIAIRAYGAVVHGNHFESRFGTGINLLEGGAAASVVGNQFNDLLQTAPNTQIDIDVHGVGHHIGPNAHSIAANQTFVRLAENSNGILSYDTVFGAASKIQDATNSTRWTKFISGVSDGHSQLHNLTIGGGAQITKHLSSTQSSPVWYIPNNNTPQSYVDDGGVVVAAVTVTGASPGDTVAVGLSGLTTAGVLISGAVTQSNVVAVTLLNRSGGGYTMSGTLRADVWRH